MFLSTPSTLAEGNTPDSNSKVFTDEDLEKYKKSPGQFIIHEQKEQTENRKKETREKEYEYWCKLGTYHNNRVNNARKKVELAEKELGEEELKDTWAMKDLSIPRKKLADAKAELAKTAADLDAVEQEAHRKGILPGWLRCQK